MLNAALCQSELLNHKMAIFSQGSASGCNTMNFGRINRSAQRGAERCVRRAKLRGLRLDGGGMSEPAGFFQKRIKNRC